MASEWKITTSPPDNDSIRDDISRVALKPKSILLDEDREKLADLVARCFGHKQKDIVAYRALKAASKKKVRAFGERRLTGRARDQVLELRELARVGITDRFSLVWAALFRNEADSAEQMRRDLAIVPAIFETMQANVQTYSSSAITDLAQEFLVSNDVGIRWKPNFVEKPLTVGEVRTVLERLDSMECVGYDAERNLHGENGVRIWHPTLVGQAFGRTVGLNAESYLLLLRERSQQAELPVEPPEADQSGPVGVLTSSSSRKTKARAQVDRFINELTETGRVINMADIELLCSIAALALVEHDNSVFETMRQFAKRTCAGPNRPMGDAKDFLKRFETLKASEVHQAAGLLLESGDRSTGRIEAVGLALNKLSSIARLGESVTNPADMGHGHLEIRQAYQFCRELSEAGVLDCKVTVSDSFTGKVKGFAVSMRVVGVIMARLLPDHVATLYPNLSAGRLPTNQAFDL